MKSTGQMRYFSSAVFGKYQFATMADDGMFYADADFDLGPGIGKPRPGSLPSLIQNTPELAAKAAQLHQEMARKMVDAVFRDGSGKNENEAVRFGRKVTSLLRCIRWFHR